jgi:predicted GNAT family acetyltransferase
MTEQAQGVVTDQRTHSRYEITAGGKLAGFLNYKEANGRRDLVHTEVGAQFEGQGLAAQLVRGALDEARASGRKIVPSCSYVAKFVERHPDYQDLVVSRQDPD